MHMLSVSLSEFPGGGGAAIAAFFLFVSSTLLNAEALRRDVPLRVYYLRFAQREGILDSELELVCVLNDVGVCVGILWYTIN